MTSMLLGTIEDPSGAAVQNATVTLTNEGTGGSFKTQSTASGTYVFEALQPGNYTLTVESPGFKKFVSKGNVVTIGQPATVNVKLELGPVTQRVEVSGATEQVQTSTSGNVGNLLPGQEIRDLPIVGTRGRNPLQLIDLQPGVVDTPVLTGGAVYVFGARDRAWNYTLDGIDVNETSAPGSNFSPLRTNPDSLAEFRVVTSNATPEYGTTSGGQVTMITRSGTNQFHGTGFEFYRTPRLNANEWQNNFFGNGKAQFVQHIFGGDMGGPIWKNHTFFFFNVQGLAASNSYSITRTVFTQQARQGILRYVPGGRNGNAGAAVPSVDANGNVLPGVNVATYNAVANDPQHIGLDKYVQGLLASAPLPNRFDVGDGLNTAGFNFTAPQEERQHDVVFKIDQILNPKNTVYARVAFGEQDTNCDSVNGGLELFPGTGCQVNTQRSPRNYAFNWRWNPTARITNEAVLGYNKFTFNFAIPANDLSKFTYNSGPVAAPFYDFGNARTLRTWQFVDNFAYQLGSHALKFGTNLRFQQHYDQRGSVGSYNATTDITSAADFDPAAFNMPAALNTAFDLPDFRDDINFLLGRIGEIQRGFPNINGQFTTGILPYKADYKELDYYAQDTWKVSRNLTVDFGLRLEMRLTPTSPNEPILHPDQPLVAGAAATNTAKWVPGSLFPSRFNNLGPSVGFAWDPFGTGKTSIRANYRIAYDSLNTFVLSSRIFNSLPGIAYSYDNVAFGQGGGRLSNLQLPQPPSVDPATFRNPAPFSSSAITVVDPNLKDPTTHEWSLEVQREVARDTVVSAAYIGRRAYHLFGSYNANQPNIFTPGFLDAFNIVKAGGQSPLLNTLFSANSLIRSGETASDMIRRVYSSTLALNSVASLYSALGTRIQGTTNPMNVTALSGQSPFAVIPFPQFSGAVNVIDSNDFSTYNGLILQVSRRLHNGISWQVSYTFSKALDTRAFDPTFTIYGSGTTQTAASTPFDIYNRGLNYAPSDADHTHVWQGNWTWELPFGNGRRYGAHLNPVVDRVIGGWEIGGFFNYYSGRPFTVYGGNFPFSSVVGSPANCSGCSHSLGSVFNQDGIEYFFNSNARGQFSLPAAGQLGNTGATTSSGRASSTWTCRC